MEYVIRILILFILIGNLLKLSFWKFWQVALFGFLCAIFIIGTQQWAILQSKTELADFLNNTKEMQNISIWICFEFVLCFAFCFTKLSSMFGIKKEKKWWQMILHWYPGFLIFPALFLLQIELIFTFPGIDFFLLSYTLAIIIFITIPLLSYVFKWFCSEQELCIEIYFLVNLLSCIFGLSATVNNNINYAIMKQPLNIKAILLFFILSAICFIIGYLWHNYQWKLKK